MVNNSLLSQIEIYQQELMDSEFNFRTFFESIDHMFIVSDLEGNIIHCNKSLIDKLGYSLLELKNMNSIQLHPIEKREEIYNLIEKLVKKEIDYSPLDVVAKSGEIYSLETKIWLGKWDGQDCLFSASKDITKENENLQLFSKIFENNPLSMSINTIDESKFIKINPAFTEIIGYSEEETLDKTINELDVFIDVNEFNSIKNRALDNENIKDNELILRAKDGSFITGLFSLEVINIQGIKSLLIVMVDITKKREQSLELENFFSLNLDLLCIADMEGNFIKTNKAWEDILGYGSDELKKRKFLEFVHPDDMEKTLEAMKDLDKGRQVLNFTNRYRGIDGEYRYIEWRSNGLEGKIYAAARDITERIKYEKKILEISNRDALTNIYNRRYIFDRAKEIIQIYKRTGQLFSVCIMDIDHFKKINDKYGHQIGDMVLKEFTKTIDKSLRPYDILGRYGGEEFIVILYNINRKNSILVIERILNIVRNKAFIFHGHNIKLTFSGGISNCVEVDRDRIVIDDLIRLADKRMYMAKDTGRNRIVSI